MVMVDSTGIPDVDIWTYSGDDFLGQPVKRPVSKARSNTRVFGLEHSGLGKQLCFGGCG